MSMEEPNKLLKGSFMLQVTLTDRRALQMTGYIYADDDPHTINRRLDEWQDMLDRQAVRCDMTTKLAEAAQADASIAELAEHYDMMLNKKKKGSLNSQERLNMDQYEGSVRMWHKKKETALAAIEAAKKRLNGAA